MKLGGFIGARPTWNINSRAGVWRLRDTFKFISEETWPNIVGIPLPKINLTLDSSSIFIGDSTIIRWSTTDATSVVSSNFGATGVSGSVSVNPSTSTTYTLTLSGPGGTTTQSNTLVVSQPTPSISVSPSVINRGNSATLFWSASGATSVSTNFGQTATSGSITVNPTSTTTYTITAFGPAGSASNAASLIVTCTPATTSDLYGLYYANSTVTASRGNYTGNLLYQTTFYSSSTYATQPPDPRGFLTYTGIIYYIDQAYRSVGRPADQNGITFWGGQFINNPSTYPTLSSLYNAIRNSYYTSVEYNTYGFITGYSNTCGETWNTSY